MDLFDAVRQDASGIPATSREKLASAHVRACALAEAVANGPERDSGLRAAIGERENVTVTEGRNGEGVYEAVVGTLVERR